jgi:hypothetical protein
MLRVGLATFVAASLACAVAPTLAAALAVVAIVSIATFIPSQRRAAHPMLPLDLFRNRTLVAALGATFTMTFGIYGLLLVNSFAFQQQRGASALVTALWFLPMPLVYLVLIPAVNALAHRTGPRPGMTAGLALNTGPAVGLAMSAVMVQRAGLAAGVVNLARLVGITVGVAVLGSATAAVGGVGGARTAMALGAVVQLAGAFVALRWARPEPAPATTVKEVSHA